MGAADAWGAPTLTSNVGLAQGVLLEALVTILLVFTIFGTAVSSNAPRAGGFGIGLAVSADVLFGGPFTGIAMNPARAMGPMIASLSIPSHWYLYWIGPVVAAFIVGLFYGFLFENRSRDGDK